MRGGKPPLASDLQARTFGPADLTGAVGHGAFADTLAAESDTPKFRDSGAILWRSPCSGAFDPKAAAVLVEAFNEIIDELDLRTIADRERAARIVIELAASKSTLDVANLRDEAVDLIGNESVGVHGSDFDQLGGLPGHQGDAAGGRGHLARPAR